ncbi:MAG: hypothetical protein IPP49_10985 [Saprospiraceae bacterium]|nr:hypothetical protein [Saprospiraceae bacterium]
MMYLTPEKISPFIHNRRLFRSQCVAERQGFLGVTLQVPFGKADASLFKKSNKRPEGQEMPDFGG